MTNVAVIGAQWGDEGKGKVVDWLASRADIVVRFQGGHNAGHTLVVGSETYKLSLLPSGLVRGKLGIIGNGVVVDPEALLAEIARVSAQGLKVSPETLRIAENAVLILPLHGALDRAREEARGERKIGTTGRGIGPAYEDKVARRAIRVCDLAEPETLAHKLDELLLHHNTLLQGLGAATFSKEELLDRLLKLAPQILPFAEPVWERLDQARRAGSRILFEGAQAVMLDVDHGTYPFVTSSNATAGGACTGAGISPIAVTRVIAIAKAYITRVGEGPFPTELFDEDGEKLRKIGAEFGTTTGRPRRCGWFDLPIARYASRINGITDLVVTKLDVLSGWEQIPVCVAYEVDGERHDELPMTQTGFHHAKPIYEFLPGWTQDISSARSLEDLPANAQAYVQFLEDRCGSRISAIGVGPEREQTIVLRDLLN